MATPSPQSGQPSPHASRAWVLLCHTLPDASWHYDWMIEAVAGGPLHTFRTLRRPDDPATLWFEATRIGDHRREYLMQEGTLSGNRGEVRRVSQGFLIAWEASAERIACTIESGELVVTWTGQRLTLGAARREQAWVFERAATLTDPN